MKKSVLSVILGASLMVSSSAFALTAMTDSNMKDATGQAGVSIALDDVTLYQYVGATTYTDTDGLASLNTGDSAGIKITGAETLTTIRAILDGGNRGGFLTQNYGAIMTDHAGAAATFTSADGNVIDVSNNRTGTAIAQYDAGTGAPIAIGAIKVAPLTIDVSSKVQALSYGMAYNSASYIAAVWTALQSVPEAAGDLETRIGMAVTGLLTTKNIAMSDTEQDVITGLVSDMDAKIELANTGLDPVDDAAEITTNTNAALAPTSAMGVAMAGVNVAGVVIGLPTIEIVKTGSVKTISLTGTSSANNDDEFISIKTGKSSLAVLGGYIEICPH